MPQSKEVHKEYMRKARESAKQALKERQYKDIGSQNDEVHNKGSQEYPAILYALTDPIKRLKLEKIHQSLKDHGVEKLVLYGFPPQGIPFDRVGDLLEATT